MTGDRIRINQDSCLKGRILAHLAVALYGNVLQRKRQMIV